MSRFWRYTKPITLELHRVSHDGESCVLYLDWVNHGPPEAPRFELEVRMTLGDLPQRWLFDDVLTDLATWESQRGRTPWRAEIDEIIGLLGFTPEPKDDPDLTAAGWLLARYNSRREKDKRDDERRRP